MTVSTSTDSAAISSKDTLSDKDLVNKIRNGDINALERIMRRYNQRLFRIARSILKDEHEAMDVVQETYIKAYYQIAQFKGPDGFISWLSRIASNEALMKIRKSKQLDYSLDENTLDDDAFTLTEPEPLSLIANQQLQSMIEKEVDKLPIDYRRVYVMRAIEQLSTQETANLLNITVDNVKTRYLRSKRLLQHAFDAHLKEAELELFEFAGERCNAVVAAVLATLNINSTQH